MTADPDGALLLVGRGVSLRSEMRQRVPGSASVWAARWPTGCPMELSRVRAAVSALIHPRGGHLPRRQHLCAARRKLILLRG